MKRGNLENPEGGRGPAPAEGSGSRPAGRLYPVPRQRFWEGSAPGRDCKGAGFSGGVRGSAGWTADRAVCYTGSLSEEGSPPSALPS
jgi:hypothetical protein